MNAIHETKAELVNITLPILSNPIFYILESVEQQKGLCDVGREEDEHTICSSSCNMDKGVYYYETCGNSQFTGIDMYQEDLESENWLFIRSIIASK
ncbi:linear amide C-N hydrolase [Listeria ivanovii]|nr:hypothetical protein JL53_11450 [Listeria ivanovii subsp. londoniensis]MBM5607207.1 linear amide C-N hydrolase [Listeria ivanovii]MBM5635743.1 linear amide C-N hydrolase [Listeria ivanovii]MBM5705966.1 linear amide C-N hydrolase [Listeria ivanovii]